jgi:predicted carbohydrate-binding protein with CBM5 and CBM33 domain
VKIRRTTVGRSIVVGLVAAVVAALIPATSWAHGAMLTPGSRTYLCYKDGLTSTGEIKPTNAACQNALAVGGTQPFYDWFGVLRSDGAGRTRGFIPDGALCSGGNTKYAGFDAPRNDWPLTHLTSGASFTWTYAAWAAHPGWFYLYVTKDGYDPNQALTWADMEETPFGSADHPPINGTAPSGYYYWTGNLPNKTGRHVIYSVWQRSDSTETFYGCSDVVFDGGNGEVTGICPGCGGGNPSPSPTVSTSASPTTSPSTSPSASTPAPSSPAAGACLASYTIVNSWPGGFQAEVVIKAGATAINGWTAKWTFADGQTITQLWSGTFTASGSTITVNPVSWNASLAAGASTSFGFLGTQNGTNAVPTVSCTSA